jgi:hypothetical protein
MPLHSLNRERCHEIGALSSTLIKMIDGRESPSLNVVIWSVERRVIEYAVNEDRTWISFQLDIPPGQYMLITAPSYHVGITVQVTVSKNETFQLRRTTEKELKSISEVDLSQALYDESRIVTPILTPEDPIEMISSYLYATLV